METCSEYLLRIFREWEATTGHRQSVSSFARYLDVNLASLARWMRGDGVPDLENSNRIAAKLDKLRELAGEIDYLPEYLAGGDPGEVNKLLHQLLSKIVVNSNSVELYYR